MGWSHGLGSRNIVTHALHAECPKLVHSPKAAFFWLKASCPHGKYLIPRHAMHAECSQASDDHESLPLCPRPKVTSLSLTSLCRQGASGRRPVRMDVCIAWSGRAVGLHSRARVSDWGPVSTKPCASRVHGFSHCALAAIGLRSRRRWGDGECNVATSGRARGLSVGGTHLRVAGLEGVFTWPPHASHIAHHISVYSCGPHSAPPMVPASGASELPPRARRSRSRRSRCIHVGVNAPSRLRGFGGHIRARFYIRGILPSQ